MIRLLRITVSMALVVTATTAITELEPASPSAPRMGAEQGDSRSPVVPDDIADLIGRTERAVVQGDIAVVRDVRRQLLSGLEEATDSALGMRRYAFGYVSWRLNHLLQDDEDKRIRKEGRRMLEEAQRVLQKLLEDEPGNAEAHALHGSVLGEQIGRSMWRGMRLGPKASAALNTAHGLDKENPRIALQRGISFLFTPRLFGGGLNKAEKELRRAVALFQEEPASLGWRDWGRADAHIWLGQALTMMKEHGAAREEYNKALALEPNYQWVSAALLPALAEQEAKERDR